MRRKNLLWLSPQPARSATAASYSAGCSQPRAKCRIRAARISTRSAARRAGLSARSLASAAARCQSSSDSRSQCANAASRDQPCWMSRSASMACASVPRSSEKRRETLVWVKAQAAFCASKGVVGLASAMSGLLRRDRCGQGQDGSCNSCPGSPILLPCWHKVK
ncbi:hypothetical protein E3U25_01500 (plasmid) [Paracoccus versutus]|nr:hypothetical protein E3U25_01500 [Paracoccus versutus]